MPLSSATLAMELTLPPSTKGDEFSKKKVVRFPFYLTVTNLNNLVFNIDLLKYTGTGEASYFKDSGTLSISRDIPYFRKGNQFTGVYTNNPHRRLQSRRNAQAGPI